MCQDNEKNVHLSLARNRILKMCVFVTVSNDIKDKHKFMAFAVSVTTIHHRSLLLQVLWW
jgi:hypothetical protein